jgi:predicted 2-oxoglutarate/Fe(II)-dependent dioxygenase YbiX
MSSVINHGHGIIEFVAAANIEFSKFSDKIEKLKQKAIEENFTVVLDENGNPIHALNQGGFIYSLQDMAKAPLRLQGLGSEIYNEFEPAIYSCLLQYIEMFPAILSCLWWRTSGHILSYSTGGSLGLHSDNDVNYRYGKMPSKEHATRNVLSAIVFINDWSETPVPGAFCGGEMLFPYADVAIKPQKGNILLFPANYVAAHEISTITSGERLTYLAWFAQGSESQEKGINPQLEISDTGGQVWLSSITEDYDEYINGKYSGMPPARAAAHRSRSNDHG